MAGIIDEIKQSFAKGNIVLKLIYLNVGVFTFVKLTEVLLLLFGVHFSFNDFLALPAYTPLLLHRPWTIITYMFMHGSIMHIFFNLLWLYWIGDIFLRYFTSKQLLGVYISGGLCGALSYIILYNLSPAFQSDLYGVQLVGASASILAIVAAVATIAPNHPIQLIFIGKVKMKYLALASIIIYTIGVDSDNAGGNAAHIGGMLYGFLFAYSFSKGKDITKPISRFFDWLQAIFQKGQQDIHISYNNMNWKKAHKPKRSKQEEINRVLKKVSKSGYDSLSKEEKELLFKMGDD